MQQAYLELIERKPEKSDAMHKAFIDEWKDFED